jgi:uncharacterized protein YjbI with pentapeptide repeats
MMDQEIVQADALVTDLTSTTKPLFSLRNRTISGTLDLKYRTIDPAVDLQGCHFLDDVDLRWCNFEQTVNLTGCTFDHAFNKIDQDISQTIYCKKDFTCNGAIFEGPFSLNSAKIEGNASFERAQFKSKQEEIDFVGFHSEGQLNCNRATFLGSVSFASLKCEGSGIFTRATFHGDVDLGNSSFGSYLAFSGATFIKDTWFLELRCQSLYASLSEEYGATTFHEKATFDRLKCAGPGFFKGTTFKNDVSFIDASFGSELNFSQVEASGDNALEASLGEGYGSTTFYEKAAFDRLKCDTAGFFRGTIFKKGVSFAGASFGSDLDCTWDEASANKTTFGGKVSLYALKCGGDGNFYTAQFQGEQESDFSYSRFEGSLLFPECSFSCPLKLEQVEISRGLDLTANQFQDVSLYNATIQALMLSYEEEGVRYTLPRSPANLDLHRFTFEWPREKEVDQQFASRLDLRGLTFNRLVGSKEDALQFAKAQKPEVFSLDPYAQIEDYYEKVGKDTEARDVHYEGQLAMQRNAAASSEITWTFGRKASDTFLRLLTGYGVRTGRVFFLIVLFLLFGMLVFSIGDFTPLDEALAVKTSATPASSAAAQQLSDSKPTVMDQIAYSVDRFIPINMGFEDGFEPHKTWSAAYSLIHVVAGWLLLPLFLASWAGLVRSRR